MTRLYIHNLTQEVSEYRHIERLSKKLFSQTENNIFYVLLRLDVFYKFPDEQRKGQILEEDTALWRRGRIHVNEATQRVTVYNGLRPVTTFDIYRRIFREPNGKVVPEEDRRPYIAVDGARPKFRYIFPA